MEEVDEAEGNPMRLTEGAIVVFPRPVNIFHTHMHKWIRIPFQVGQGIMRFMHRIAGLFFSVINPDIAIDQTGEPRVRPLVLIVHMSTGKWNGAQF